MYFVSRDPMSRVQFVFDDFEIIVYEEYASYKLQNCKFNCSCLVMTRRVFGGGIQLHFLEILTNLK